MASDYKDTMNLPATDFPMRAGLATSEPRRLAHWEEIDLYHQVLAANEGHETYILHDGPPYANGPIHIGHAFNKILKDFIVKYQSQRGRYAPYVPGWDCHGQPIEHMVEEKLGPDKMARIDQVTLRRLCREWAERYVDIQREGFKRLGVQGEWNDPYLTFLPEYEAGNVEIFKRMYLEGSIYRGRKPIHWCCHCHTALAEAEIEYGDEESPSIYVKFPLDSLPEAFAAVAGAPSVVIWTTTPWTLPANTAVALAPQADYVAVLVEGEMLILAEALLEQVAVVAGWDSYELALDAAGDPIRVPGEAFVGITYTTPIVQKVKGTVIVGDHVTLDTGTGCVHTAPGHGQDDYLVGMKYHLPLLMPVDDEGVLDEGAGRFAGLDVNAANPAIIAWLREQGTLVAEKKIVHSYPHCWRCHEPVIFRATDQWFVSMDTTGLRAQALAAIDEVVWTPDWAVNRIGAMVADRPDWCISRQRSWGVPIPVFECAACGETIATEATFDAVIELFKTEGADAWFKRAPQEYLPEGTCCPACGGTQIEPEKDILDVWWESGVSHTSVLEARSYLHRPADLYLEGSDQHRGWFQSSLLTSVGTYGEPPYRGVMSCGFIVDANGRKMSKSLGNGVDPADVIAKNGADVLRLWVASVDYSQDVSISDEIVQRASEAYRRIRNTFRYLLSNLFDFDDTTDGVSWEDLPAIDRWALARTQQVLHEVTQAYDDLRFHVAYRALYEFIVSDLSAVYMDVAKDRLYSAAATSVERRAAQTVLANVLEVLVRCFAPFLTFTADEVWEYFPVSMGGKGGAAGAHAARRVEAVQLAGWPTDSDFVPSIPSTAATLLEQYEVILAVRKQVTEALERARAEKTIGKSQEAHVTVTAPEAVKAVLDAQGPAALAELFIVSKVDTRCGGEEPSVTITVAEGERCPRCWNIRTLGGVASHPDVCERCARVLEEQE
jgi:isoleucyl-tRNA synthetase